MVISSVVLLYCTTAIWSLWGYHTGWLFPVLVAAIHFLFGGARGANLYNQAQAYGVVYGTVAYGLLRVIA